MADIVELQAFEQRRTRRRDIDGVAEIVVFPGVRIDRKRFSLAERLIPAERKAAKLRRKSVPARRDD